MTKSTPPKKPNSKSIFIDAMVIQSAGSSRRSKSEAVIKCLDNFEKEGFKIAMSEFTAYENLHGLTGQEMRKAITLLSKFENKVVTKKVLVLAAFFGGFYHDQKIDDIGHGDKILAATALLEDGLIFTENHKDFPNPFFVRKRHVPVCYEVGKHIIKTMDFVLYEPDIALIARLFKERASK